MKSALDENPELPIRVPEELKCDVLENRKLSAKMSLDRKCPLDVNSELTA
jgi:hypothetical protein